MRRAPKKGGYKARPTVPISTHALERFRTHWPVAANLYDSEIHLMLSDQIVDALGRDDFIIAPSGVFVPIHIFDEDGYAVLVDQRVRTVMPLAWCVQVDQVRKKRNAINDTGTSNINCTSNTTRRST
jgi:hypothetical protein